MADDPPLVHPVRGARAVTRWWAGGHGVAGSALGAAVTPLELLYRAVLAVRNQAFEAEVLRVHRVAVPVVSVGNLAVGGAGKTPVAAWLVDQLIARGHVPALLHGGYAHDEPALHRAWHPGLLVFAERDRVAAAHRAIAAGASVLILDDGFQHRRLARDVDLLLVAAENWRKPRRLLPRGPWREPAAAAKRATLIVVTRKVAPESRAAGVATELERLGGRPVARIALLPAGWRNAAGGDGRPAGEAMAVAAVADPELFAASAQSAGATVAELHAYPDHFRYSARDAAAITRAARGRPILTTEKDWIKLASLLDDTQVWLLQQRVVVEDGAALIRSALDGLAA